MNRENVAENCVPQELPCIDKLVRANSEMIYMVNEELENLMEKIAAPTPRVTQGADSSEPTILDRLIISNSGLHQTLYVLDKLSKVVGG